MTVLSITNIHYSRELFCCFLLSIKYIYSYIIHICSNEITKEHIYAGKILYSVKAIKRRLNCTQPTDRLTVVTVPFPTTGYAVW